MKNRSEKSKTALYGYKKTADSPGWLCGSLDRFSATGREFYIYYTKHMSACSSIKINVLVSSSPWGVGRCAGSPRAY